MTDRARVLGGLGASDSVVEELLPRTGPLFQQTPSPALPFADEPHVATWERYEAAAREGGVVPVLRGDLPQLRFPVREGISTTEAYRRAVRRGQPPPDETPALELENPAGTEIRILSTLAGRIPALVAVGRADFETLVRVFSARNEPRPVPASMGACLVRNLTNWGRLRAYREDWEGGQPMAFPGAWQRELARLQAEGERSLYQDRFLILSRGPYSDVPAIESGHRDAEWRSLSLRIREEHEGAHYLALRAGAELRDAPADELLADWLGLVRATGAYPDRLARRCLGLEGGTRYRDGGRLENYLGGDLSADALGILCRLLDRAVHALASIPLPRDEPGLARLFLHLSSRSLESLAISTDSAQSTLSR